MTQTSITRFIAYATTLVMGFVLLGFAVRTPVASAGAIFLLLSQGLVVTLLFYARDFAVEDSSGLFGIGWLAWLVAPGMLGQVIVLLGTFQAGRTMPAAYALAVMASFGVLLSGAGAARFVYRQRFAPPVL
jgi:formate hydrogenlyase subunit 3/multisubunit Na+/H+ antiporter MnhD subunit